MEDYNFDVPEGMDLMVHRHRRDPDNSDIQQNWQTGMTPVCQTMSCVTQDEWDTIDDDSLTEAFVADCQNMDEEDFGDSDDESIADLERDTWAAACSSAFRNAVGVVPPEATDVRPAVVFSNRLFSGEELADTIVSVRGNVPMSLVLQAMDKGVAMIPSVADRPVQRMISGSVGWDVKMDEVSVVSWPMCVRPIGMYDANTAKTYSMRMCLLYPDAGNLKGGSVDSQRLSVCHDCLCLMALFHQWAEWAVWTGPDAGYCRTMAWEEQYLPRLHPPCVVDRLCGYSTEINVPGFVLMLNRERNISTQRCACTRRTSLGVFSAGRISQTLSGCCACVGGSVDCSDWLRAYCADCTADFSAGGVWIGYIRPVLWDRSLIDAAPMTASLVSSALFDCRDLLLDLLHVGHFVVRIVSYLLDLGYSSSGLASVGRWQRTVRRWWKKGLASHLVSSYTFCGMLRKRWWIYLRRVSYTSSGPGSLGHGPEFS